MPPKSSKKRRADDMTSDEDGQAPAPAKKKLTKEERAALRERARLSMTPAGKAKATPKKPAAQSNTPAKRRKLNTSSTSTAAASTSTAKKAASLTLAASPTKMTKKQLKERARLVMTTGSPDGLPVQAPTSTTTTTNPPSRRKGRTSTSTSTARASVPSNEEDNTMPMPPAAVLPGTTATTTNESSNNSAQRFNYTPVLQQPPQQHTSPTPTGTNNNPFLSGVVAGASDFAPMIPPRMDTGVVVPPQPSQQEETIIVDNDDNDGDVPTLQLDWKRVVHILRTNKLGCVILFAAYMIHSGSWVYNEKTGMGHWLGTTRIPYVREKDRVAYLVDDDSANTPELVQEPTRICYEDSPDDVLVGRDDDKGVDAFVNKKGCASTVPCPHNAVCFGKSIIGCQGPIWELYDYGGTIGSTDDDDSTMPEPLCILSKSVNDTYQEIVELLEQWSIDHMCLTRKDGVTPIAFYEPNATDATALVLLGDGARNAGSGIPLYPWSTLYKEGPDSLDDWDFEFLQMVNQAHHKLALDEGDSGPAGTVGLSKNQYEFVERNKLETPCRVARSCINGFTWLGNAIVGGFTWLGNAIVSAFWWLAMFLWNCLKTNPITTVVAGLFTGLVTHIYSLKRNKNRIERRVVEVRQMVLVRLQQALREHQGRGMNPGEVAVIHLRDEFADRLHGGYGQDKQRREFIRVIWPRVVQSINWDNRVRKDHRAVAGSGRDLWTWAASAPQDIQQD